MAIRKKGEPRTLVQLVCTVCSKPIHDGTTPNYYGTTLPLGAFERGEVACPNGTTHTLAEVGRTKEG